MVEERNALFAQAYQLQQENQLEQAIRLYERLIAQDPTHLDALRFSALAHAQLGNISDTLVLLTKALEQAPQDANLHNNLANAYKVQHKHNQAIHHYQKAIDIEPNYAQAHNNLASIYTLQNNYQQALKHYCAAVQSQPDFTAAHYNLGLLFLKYHELDAAKKQFNNVIALHPEHLDAHFYLGVLYLDAQHLVEAENAFQTVLSLNNEHVFSLTNLGVIALKHEQHQLAIDYFTKALAFDPSNVEARNNMAATFIHHDRYENALTHYCLLLEHDPNNSEYLYNSGVAQMALGHLTEAITLFEQVLQYNTQHFAALNNLAAIQIRLGHRQEAITLLQRAVTANPSDTASQFMLNALIGKNKKPTPCSDYIHNLFNNYALYYDQHMQGSLNYNLPFSIITALNQLGFTHFKHTLDLGCGTGLSGLVVRNASEHLTGVDIAEKMLAQAREKHIYDDLIEAELLSYLQDHATQYDLIIAADVLPYSGDLQPLFSVIKQHLTSKGLFVFSIEISQSEYWELQDSARFCHHPDYIQQLCVQEQLNVLHQEKLVARQQNTQNVYVMLYVLSSNP